MLSDLHAGLRRLLFERGLIDPRDVDVEFDPPIRAWVHARTKPTVSLFLYDVQENTDLRKGGIETTRANGRGQHRMPPRRFDLCYLVSTLSTEVEDEHLLLWRVLVTLMKHPILPPELLPSALQNSEIQLTTKMERPDETPKALEIWSALEMPPRPALTFVVTVPVDLDIAIDAPLVLTRTARYHRARGEPQGASVESRTHIGGVVRDRQGRPLAGAQVVMVGSAAQAVLTTPEGEFTIAGVPSGPVSFEVTHPTGSQTVSFTVPADSYQIVVD